MTQGMKQQHLFDREPEKPTPPRTRNRLPRRMTWREDGRIYRGRPRWVSPAIGTPRIYGVWITHTPRGYDLGWNRVVGVGQVVAEK